MRFSLRSSASDSLAERCSWICAQVAEAKGGVLLVDEAYSIVKGEQHQNDSYGKEAIETIMKHLDPPTCVRRAFPSVTAQSVPPGHGAQVFIFAGYDQPMEEFLKVRPVAQSAGLSRWPLMQVNAGLARRIPYRESLAR